MHVRKNIPLIVLALAIATVPLLVTDPYYLTMLIFIGIYAIATMGLNLLMGYAGQISLGHAAFFALGAYVPAILTTRFDSALHCCGRAGRGFGIRSGLGRGASLPAPERPLPGNGHAGLRRDHSYCAQCRG